MENPPIDPWLAAYQFSVFLASIVVWVQLIARWRRRGVILDYEPRRPVPWGRVAVVPPIAFMLLALSSGQPPQAVDSSTAIANLLASMLLQTLTVAIVIGVAVMSGAEAFDLGLPASPRQLASDVVTGVVACLAAIAPVHTIQMLLLTSIGQEEPSQHPLVKMLTGGDASFVLLVAGSATAVVVAPLCEEIIYRLMLQGWLEKWEDERVARLDVKQASTTLRAFERRNNLELNDEARLTNDESGTTSEEMPAEPNSAFNIGHSSLPSDQPHRGLFGLPRGWLPILISSSLFAAAHAGYGPEPVPIFMLALILGYVYQRTHRIVPTIVAHSLFNLVTMIALWRLVFHPVE